MVNPLIVNKSKSVSMSKPEHYGGEWATDDYSVNKYFATKTGTIEATPINPKDIANKAYVDSKTVTETDPLSLHLADIPTYGLSNFNNDLGLSNYWTKDNTAKSLTPSASEILLLGGATEINFGSGTIPLGIKCDSNNQVGAVFLENNDSQNGFEIGVYQGEGFMQAYNRYTTTGVPFYFAGDEISLVGGTSFNHNNAQLKINNSGNVLVNTISDDSSGAKLQVNGNSNLNGSLCINSSGTPTQIINIDGSIGFGAVNYDVSSIAIGGYAIASGPYSIAIGGDYGDGSFTTAVNEGDVAIGTSAYASGTYSYALGPLASATGRNSLSIGTQGSADGTYSMKLGTSGIATADRSIIIGSFQNSDFGGGTHENIDLNSIMFGGINPYGGGVNQKWLNLIPDNSSTKWLHFNISHLPSGTLVTPPSGINQGDVWMDTTTSATHPILRIKA